MNFLLSYCASCFLLIQHLRILRGFAIIYKDTENFSKKVKPYRSRNEYENFIGAPDKKIPRAGAEIPGECNGGKRPYPRDPRRGLSGSLRSFRLRKKHHAESDLRPGDSDRGPHLFRRTGYYLPGAGAPGRRHGLSELCPLPAPDRGKEHPLPPGKSERSR